MEPKSLSASSAQVFEGCEARWRAEYLERGRDASNSAAALGTVCHDVLERLVKAEYHLNPPPDIDKVINDLYEAAWWREFSDAIRYLEGLKLVHTWWKRQDWEGRTVLSTETKKSFPIKHGDFEVPFNYIMDRVDRHDDGTIEVIDYKTVALNVTAEDLYNRIQARCYALAARIEHPDADKIWVTFDLLRHEPVGVAYTRDDAIATWRYLQDLLGRILASDGTKETLNAECRWCIRKHECSALAAHLEVGGPLSITDPEEAANKRFEIESAMAALKIMVDDLDDVIERYCEEEQLTEFDTAEGVKVKLAARGTRGIAQSDVVRIIGPELAAANGTMTMRKLDDLVKSDDITNEQKVMLKQAITKTYGTTKVRTSRSI